MREILVDIALIAACALALTAAIGLLRFPDIYTRAHAATKPQNLGMLMVLIGVAISIADQLGMIVLIFGFQLATAPVAANMVARAAYRINAGRQDKLYIDEYADE